MRLAAIADTEKLGEVTYMFDGSRTRVLAGKTFDEFCEKFGI